MNKPRPIRCVLLDVDGTLVDSNDAHAHAWEKAFREHGYQVPFDRIRPLIGMGGDKLLPLLAGIEPGSLDGELVSDQRRVLFLREYLPFIVPQPGAAALVRELRERGIRVAVSSSAEADEVMRLLRVAGVDDMVDEVITKSDAGGSKPEPDTVGLALRRIGCRADRALMIGDTPYDIEAASAAGVATVALRCGGFSNQDLAGAIAVYDDPAALASDLDAVLS